MVICLVQNANDLHIVQSMILAPAITSSTLSKSEMIKFLVRHAKAVLEKGW